MILLLAAGTVLGVGALLALGFGFSIKETTFGNAALLSGAMLLCTTVLLFGLIAVLRELKAVRRELVAGVGRPIKRAALGPQQAPGPAPSQPPEGAEAHPQPSAAPPWAAEAAARERRQPPTLPSHEEGAAVVPPEPPPAAAPERPVRRNLLFASRRREPAGRAAGGDAPAVRAPDPAGHPPPVSTFEAESEAFDSAWPVSQQPVAASGPAETVRSEPRLPEPAEQKGASGPAHGVIVIKSGVVDGMAYSLYSDGSIEAQMPEGMLRFASLDELRAHLDRRG